jgi:NAD(P)-dependent dehydrogenase (short-subunit alcohol dehydrogenase family)
MAAVKEINETEVEKVAMGAVVDIRDRSQVESWISKTVEQFGRLDGAANVAGVTGKDLGVTPLEDVSLRRITFLTSSIANVGSRSMTKTSSSSWTSTSRVH